MLRRRLEAVISVKAQEYSGLDEILRKRLDSITWRPIADPKLLMIHTTLLFFPEEHSEFEACIEAADQELGKDRAYVAKKADYQTFFEAMLAAKSNLKIKNNTLALLELVRRGHSAIEAEFGKSFSAPPGRNVFETAKDI